MNNESNESDYFDRFRKHMSIMIIFTPQQRNVNSLSRRIQCFKHAQRVSINRGHSFEIINALIMVDR